MSRVHAHFGRSLPILLNEFDIVGSDSGVEISSEFIPDVGGATIVVFHAEESLTKIIDSAKNRNFISFRGAIEEKLLQSFRANCVLGGNQTFSSHCRSVNAIACHRDDL